MKKFFSLISLMVLAIVGFLKSAFELVLSRALPGYMNRTGMLLYWGGSGGSMPTRQDFQNYRVTDQNQSEIVRQRLYDFQIYPYTGQQQFSFFNQAVGNGKTSTSGAVAGSPKLISDTNMTNGGLLPSGMEYLIESIEVYFEPGSVSTADTFTVANPVTADTAALSTATVNQVNDVYKVYNTGFLQFTVLNKPQLQETMLRTFPPKTQMRFDAAFAAADTNTTTAIKLAAINAYLEGRPYYLEPPISLQPTSNFSVTISTPQAQTLPSGFNGRIGVVFDGYLLRAAQ